MTINEPSVLGYNETNRETTELSEEEAAKVARFGLDRPLAADEFSWEEDAQILHAEWCPCGGYSVMESRQARGLS
jgi:hypothetical protein